MVLVDFEVVGKLEWHWPKKGLVVVDVRGAFLSDSWVQGELFISEGRSFFILMMGSFPNAIKIEGLDNIGNSKGKKTVSEKEEEPGCWFKFRSIRSCLSLRSKLETSTSDTSYGIHFLIQFL